MGENKAGKFTSAEHGRTIVRKVEYEGGVTVQTLREDGMSFEQDIENGWQSEIRHIETPDDFETLWQQ